jgi:NAD(P)-dependent dehydrogenase (short-subunit alcohol dehydrogenase family)
MVFLNFAPEALRRVLAVNLDGAFNIGQAFRARRRLGGRQGRFLNLLSLAGFQGAPSRLAWVASKLGLHNVARGKALEFAPLGIRVSAARPSIIRKPMMTLIFEAPENMKCINAAHPTGRDEAPAEFAAAIACLPPDEASFLTCAVLPAEGRPSLASGRTSVSPASSGVGAAGASAGERARRGSPRVLRAKR